MMIYETKDEELKDALASCGLRASGHALCRIRQRLAPVSLDLFLADLKTACRKYRSGKAKKKKKLRITKDGIAVRTEHYVRQGGITFVFFKDYLISVYV